MKIVFFGDSVTESERDASNPHDFGNGYVKFAEGKLRLLYPDRRTEFLNRGVGGNDVSDLAARIQHDVLDEKPDVIVLQVGINDVMNESVSEQSFEKEYAALLERLVGSGAKVLILQPFALPVGDKARLRPRLDQFNRMIRAIAEKNAIPVIPMDEIFNGAAQDIKPTQFTSDGIHPTHRGHRYLADFVVKALKKYVL